MRILLAHNSLYYPSHGGGDKSNRLLMEALAARGHRVRVVARVERFGPEDHAKLLSELDRRGVAHSTSPEGIVRFERRGVDVHVVALQPNIRAYFAGQIEAFDPEVIVTSTDDPGQLLFELAVKAPRARVVHLVRATIAVPFGPDSSAPNAAKTERLKRADAIVGVSHYVAGYVREFGGMDAVHVPISLLEDTAEPPLLGRFDNPYVLMANPCAVKGIDIFLALADRLRDLRFAAVPTWGTTDEDLARLRARPNIEILPAVDDVDELLVSTRVLLVPSVWAEARSRIVVEAMSRGVPVISSTAGGLPEAHLGVEYSIPVNLIRHYRPTLDPKMVPVPEVPSQDIEPWVAALARLASDREHWEDVSRRSREAALEYVRNLNVLPFEALLEDVVRKPRRAAPAAGLTEEKRRLLALRLKQKAAPSKLADPWFAGLSEAAAHLLFCFPYAGGGTLAYRQWAPALADVAAVVAVRLPGRESRINETPFEDMPSLVAALGAAIAPHLGKPFAFFGHSMGAGVAFELTRWLHRGGLPLPAVLIVSGARAPQWRLGLAPPPDPSDEALLAELRQLEGIPRDVLENPELWKLALPALRADTRLYRRYVFEPGEPLPVPLVAYSGDTDPNLGASGMAGWRELTRASFRQRTFPGGHFYFQTATREFLAALKEDLTPA